MMSIEVSKKSGQLNISISPELLDTLEAIRAAHGVPPPELARVLLSKAAEFYQTHGFFTLPVRLEPESGFIERTIQYGTTTAIQGAKNDAKVHPETLANPTENAGEKARARATGKKVG